MERVIITVVYGPGGRTVDLDVSEDETTGAIATLLEQSLLGGSAASGRGTPSQAFLTDEDGKPVDSAKTLAQCGLWDGSILHLCTGTEAETRVVGPPSRSHDKNQAPEPVRGWRRLDQEPASEDEREAPDELKGYTWKRLDD